MRRGGQWKKIEEEKSEMKRKDSMRRDLRRSEEKRAREEIQYPKTLKTFAKNILLIQSLETSHVIAHF